MKLKHILILLFAVPFLSCERPEDLTHHYIYGNATDKTVSVQSFANYSSGRRETRAKFSLQPGEEFRLIYPYSGLWGWNRSEPFNFANEVIISNGDTTIVNTRAGCRSLLLKGTYDQSRSKDGKNIYCEFVFTDQYFQKRN